MVFFWEIKESAFYAAHLCCLKSFLPLPNRNSEIYSSLDNQNWCVPILNIIYRVEFGIGFLSYFIVFFPISTSKIPIVEENFFCGSKHTLDIENSIVGNKCLESVVVDSCQIK